jgi:serine/threonine protein kinase
LGGGGSAMAVSGFDEGLGIDIAVKQLKSKFCPETNDFPHRGYAYKFRNEAILLRSFKHPNVVKMYNYGETMIDGKCVPTIILEKLEGQTLNEGFFNDLGIEEQINIFEQMAAAVEYVHSQDIVHCDLKPDNFHYDLKKKKIVLMDFSESVPVGTPLDDEFLVTPEYFHPKTNRKDRKNGNVVSILRDRWAFAATMLGIILTQPPFGVEPIPYKEGALRTLNPDNLKRIGNNPDLIAKYSPNVCKELDQIFRNELNTGNGLALSESKFVKMVAEVMRKGIRK